MVVLRLVATLIAQASQEVTRISERPVLLGRAWGTSNFRSLLEKADKAVYRLICRMGICESPMVALGEP